MFNSLKEKYSAIIFQRTNEKFHYYSKLLLFSQSKSNRMASTGDKKIYLYKATEIKSTPISSTGQMLLMAKDAVHGEMQPCSVNCTFIKKSNKCAHNHHERDTQQGR